MRTAHLSPLDPGRRPLPPTLRSRIGFTGGDWARGGKLARGLLADRREAEVGLRRGGLAGRLK